MKTIFYLILLLCHFSINIYPQQGWFWQNPYPTGNRLFGVSFIDENIGWAVGENNTIIKTTNGGINWTSQSIGTNEIFNGVSFVNENIGWAVGGADRIYNTVDGGINWDVQSVQSWNLNNIFSIDVSNAWIAGRKIGGGGLILKTSDGGKSWLPKISGTNNQLKKVFFTDLNNGWAVGISGTIIRTSDGGENWTLQNSATNQHLEAIFFKDINNGWIVGWSGTVFNTTNGGESWNIQSSGTTARLSDVYFADNFNGAIVSSDGKIFQTNNGGETWNECNQTYQPLFAVHYTNKNSVIAVGDQIILSKDGGNNWHIKTQRITTESLEDVYFVDSDIGWAVGRSGTILKTTNGGIIWEHLESDTDKDLTGVFFEDITNGWVIGEKGTILQTSDGGENWNKQIIDTSINLSDVSFTGLSNGIVVGYDADEYSAKILKTTNNGQEWLVVYTGTGYLSAVEFIDENTGWAVGDEILKTTNAGEDWYPQNSGTHFGLTDVCFTDINTGTAVGMSTILRTTNGGESWTNQELLLAIRGVSFTDFFNGIIVGGGRGHWSYNSAIYGTTDGGETWTKQLDIFNTTILLAVHFTNKNTGTAVGTGGVILRIADDVTSTSEEQPALTPTNFFLSQNYPNPFNPRTSIEYRVGSSENVTLKIYDLLGREVATLVDEYKPAGSYEIIFDAGNLSSGMYIYKLTAGGFTSVKKLILLK